jgi:hypothetical protein
MKDKGPLIVALIVLAVILEVGLLATISNASADETPDEPAVIIGYTVPEVNECMDHAAGCPSCFGPESMPVNRMTFINEAGSGTFSNGDGSAYCGEGSYTIDPSLAELMRIEAFMNASWNFKSTWRVTPAMLSAVRQPMMVEVSFYATDDDQTSAALLEYDDGSAQAAPDNSECVSGGYSENAVADEIYAAPNTHANQENSSGKCSS